MVYYPKLSDFIEENFVTRYFQISNNASQKYLIKKLVMKLFKCSIYFSISREYKILNSSLFFTLIKFSSLQYFSDLHSKFWTLKFSNI